MTAPMDAYQDLRVGWRETAARWNVNEVLERAGVVEQLGFAGPSALSTGETNWPPP